MYDVENYEDSTKETLTCSFFPCKKNSFRYLEVYQVAEYLQMVQS